MICIVWTRPFDTSGEAIEEWKKAARVSDGVYPEDIIMGQPPRMTGSWKTELETLKKELSDLENRRENYQPQQRKVVARLDFGDGPVEAGFQSVSSRTQYRLSEGGYGWHHLYLSDRPPQLTERKLKKESYRDFIYGPRPTQYTDSAFGIDLANGYYELLFSVIDLSKTPQDHGPMWIVAQGRDSTEHFSVPAGTLVERKLETRVVDGRLNLVFNSDTDSDWMINGLVITRVGPFIGHVPIRRTSGQDDLSIQITASGPDAIQSAHLTYGSDRTGYRRISLRATGQWTYEARVPRSELVDGLTYFIQAEDLKGRRVQFPPSGADDPIRLSVDR